MKRLLFGLLLCLWLTGCMAEQTHQPGHEQALASYNAEKPMTGVFVDTAQLTGFAPPQEVYTRRSEAFVEELTSGDYGMLRPFVGSRAAFDMTIHGGAAVYNGKMGLVDGKGAIVVDPVYTDVTLLTDWNNKNTPKLWRLSKEVQKGEYMEQIYGFCTMDGFVAEPCIYESVSYHNGYIVAVENSAQGLFRIFDFEGSLLLDSASWTQRPVIYMSMGGGTVEASEQLLYITVAAGPDNWDVERWLYDWQGNLISADYDWVDLGGEAPYTFDSWDGGKCGFLDAEGNEILQGDYESVSQFYFGQAVVTQNGKKQVIDTHGNVLWTAPEEGYLGVWHTETTVYYSLETHNTETFSYRCYNKDFEPMYPEADHVSYLYDDWFLVWQEGICTVTDGTRSAVLEGAVLDQEDDYYAYDTGAKDLLLIATWKDSVQEYWLFDRELTPLSHGSGENTRVELLTDRTDGSAVAVLYPWMSYPYHYTVLDYPGAPELKNVEVLDIYGGWYLVEDEFSAGYMDEAGNWLFRVSLMTDMVD